MACLIFLDDQGAPSRFPLGKATLMLGSAQESEILLKDNTVSKNHASIIYDKNKFWLRDNGSTNGSLVNGKPAQYQQLQNGDTLQFGSYKFFFDEFYQTQEMLEKTISQNIKIIDQKGSDKKGQSYRQTVQLQPAKDSKNVPMRMMLTEKVNTIPDSLSNISQTFGYWGFIAFLPAIITGHMAQPKTASDRKNQIVGLSLGYTFLFIWLGIGLYYYSSPSENVSVQKKSQTQATTQSEIVYDFPIISNPLELIKNPMVWLPPSGIYNNILFNKPNPALEGNSALLKEVASIKSVLIHGLVWMELGSSSFKLQKALRKLQLTTETYRTNPTFWEYNSSMTPDKKSYYEPFFFPKETPQLFYDKDPTLVPSIARFSSPEFQWCFGIRGITFNLPPEFQETENLTNLRVVLVVRAGEKTSTLTIPTLEGNLTRNEPKTYNYNVTPSLLYAAIVYRISDRKPLIISTYEKYFSLEDAKGLEAWMMKNFDEVISHQPSSGLAVASPFTIKEKAVTPVTPPKPKVNFFIQETK